MAGGGGPGRGGGDMVYEWKMDVAVTFFLFFSNSYFLLVVYSFLLLGVHLLGLLVFFTNSYSLLVFTGIVCSFVNILILSTSTVHIALEREECGAIKKTRLS